MYTAELKRPMSEKISKKKEAVGALLEDLGLTPCKDTLIGDSMHRGISGGQALAPSSFIFRHVHVVVFSECFCDVECAWVLLVLSECARAFGCACSPLRYMNPGQSECAWAILVCMAPLPPCALNEPRKFECAWAIWVCMPPLPPLLGALTEPRRFECAWEFLMCKIRNCAQWTI
jgi:hypothetical protein